MLFQKSINLALVFGLVLQNSVFVIPVSAEELTSDATQMVQAEQISSQKPVYHIALTPREVSDLGIEGFKDEMLRYSEAKQAESTASTVSTLVGGALFLTATTAAYYWMTGHAFKSIASHCDESLKKHPPNTGNWGAEAENPVSTSHNKAAGNLNSINEFIYRTAGYAPAPLKSWFYSRSETVKSRVVNAVVLGGAAAAASIPLYLLKPWLANQFVYPISTSDKSRLENAFELVQNHADLSCLKAKVGKAHGADHVMIQSMHFSEEDIAAGQVYLDGKPLTLALAKYLADFQKNEYYVFTTPVVCK